MENEIKLKNIHPEIFRKLSALGCDIHLISHKEGIFTYDMALEWIFLNFNIHVSINIDKYGYFWSHISKKDENLNWSKVKMLFFHKKLEKSEVQRETLNYIFENLI